MHVQRELRRNLTALAPTSRTAFQTPRASGAYGDESRSSKARRHGRPRGRVLVHDASLALRDRSASVWNSVLRAVLALARCGHSAHRPPARSEISFARVKGRIQAAQQGIDHQLLAAESVLRSRVSKKDPPPTPPRDLWKTI